MLFNIDSNCSPELLYCLAQMGHGDELVIADRNFPATSTALQTCFQKVIPMPGFSALAAIKTITSLLPLDGFVDHAAVRMEIDGAPAFETRISIPPKRLAAAMITRSAAPSSVMSISTARAVFDIPIATS